jgi:6-phosphogluconolactonase
MSPRIERAGDAAALAELAVDRLESLGHAALLERGRFVVSLAGGSTPRAVYSRWAERSTLDWARTVLVFGDERCVPPGDARSNHGLVEAALLGRLPARPAVHRMEGEAEDPDGAARRYEQALRVLLGAEGRLDLALLGLGEDGHTASLFPGQAAVRESLRWCVSTEAPPGAAAGESPRRLTLTAPLLRRARAVIFIVSGKAKAAIVRRVLEDAVQPELLPAQLFLRDDRVAAAVLLDRAAARELRPE